MLMLIHSSVGMLFFKLSWYFGLGFVVLDPGKRFFIIFRAELTLHQVGVPSGLDVRLGGLFFCLFKILFNLLASFIC